jgi:hypothetical protein
MGALRSLGTLFLLMALAGCGGSDSSPQLVDGSPAAELPAALEGLDDAVLTRTAVVPAGDTDPDELTACWTPTASVDAAGLERITKVVERAGLQGSSWTFAASSSLYACDRIPDPAIDPDDNPYKGLWCGSPSGRLEGAQLNDPRLDLCTSNDGDVTAFVWVEPQPEAKWVVVSDAGSREVYEVAASLPVRVTTADSVNPAGSASFAVEEYAADGSKLREYTLNAQVAG